MLHLRDVGFQKFMDWNAWPASLNFYTFYYTITVKNIKLPDMHSKQLATNKRKLNHLLPFTDFICK